MRETCAFDAAAALRGRDALRVTWTGGTPTADSRAWLAELETALPTTLPPLTGTVPWIVYRGTPAVSYGRTYRAVIM